MFKKLLAIALLLSFVFISTPCFAQRENLKPIDTLNIQLQKGVPRYDGLKVTGHIIFNLYDKDGNLKDKREVNNLVVTAGKNYLAAWLAAASQAGEFMTYLAVGTDATAAGVGQTALLAEIGTRVNGTLSSSTNVWQNVGTFAAANGTGALQEAGIFDQLALGGTLLARQTFSVINKGASDSLQLTWQVTFAYNDGIFKKVICFTNGRYDVLRSY